MSDLTLDESRTRLRTHFQDHAPSAHASRWDDLWAAGDFLPWDRGLPNPALVDTLNDRHDILGEPTTAVNNVRQRKRALVPGCGKGYDVLLLASYGYDAYGLEASRNAVAAAERHASEAGDAYPARSKGAGSGSARFLYGDFFADGWVGEVEGSGRGFDLIYDYTFLSALPPELRPVWALRMSDLLAPQGHLICLEFPTYKDPAAGGPPWAMPPVVYEQHLARPGEEIPYKDGHVVEDSSRQPNDKALERIAHWQPEHTHEIGKGTDWVSIWRHRQL